MADVINHRNDFRLIFEPLAPTETPMFRYFNVRQYLRPSNDEPRFLNPMSDLLSGKLRNRWTDHFNRRFVSRRRLIKDIRAAFLLKWLSAHFPQVSIIFMLRHPCAVVNSQIKMQWWVEGVDQDFEEILSQDDLVEDFLKDVIQELRSLSNPFEKLVALWCIENIVPLKQFTPGEMHIMFYEHFCDRPEIEAERLFSYLQFKPDAAKLRERLLSPSSLASPESAIVKGTSLIGDWLKTISSAEISRVTEVLRLFGLEKIYCDSPQPLLTQPDQALTMFH